VAGGEMPTNASTTAKLVFMEFILVDEGQRSVVFVEP
jgi:hypothetical protein